MLRKEIIAKVKSGFFPESYIDTTNYTERNEFRTERIYHHRRDCES